MAKKCLFDLHDTCIVLSRLDDRRSIPKWGSPEWVRIYCSMCIKTMYAKAKNINYKLINTL